MTTKNYLSIYAKSFNWSGFFLPKKIYFKCSVLYDFCRTIDNIADQNVDLEIKRKELKIFRAKFDERNEVDSVIKNMWGLMNERNISKKIINDLFDGVNSDLKEEVRIKSEKELLIYSYRVAGTVGLMMAKIFGVKKRESLQRAIDLGIAMQLTNIARDVVEDEKKNRVYLIKNSEDLFTNIKATISKANSFYDSSFEGIKDIPLSCRFSIIVARRVYREIGKEILKKKDIESYRNAGKIYVSTFGKLIQTFFSLKDLIFLFFIKRKKYEKEDEYNIINEDIGLNERI
ncbi:MAG: phytoene synthase [Candidatus Marinimicrobia bacterium]|nr:phytoene synthase [Candidatus Neomarinimicrobiota bacterium]|tara:strand:- start:8574 stop:9437 length:864 start_codon:yes stop_codon:yes gene_type:complete